MDLLAIVREYGWAIGVSFAVGFALYAGILVWGRDAKREREDQAKAYEARLSDQSKAYDSRIAEMEREKAYREERRVEERSNRLLTEEALRNQVAVMRDMTELLKDIERSFRSGGGAS